ncbi:hypothetical protein NEPAR06_1655 [Nematocida parisii]|uniref:Major facilitator superfamily associated domain-containing protein n=1 Tax=Nematocida parisii (strain ERTm3) TaxID=935791 RepID=I3EGH5_NEMP3|nr:uncharacterized protein NEPG_01183 [Nematocida parisii ERTm1]EIJ88322.1 hypothetical protein NEQG_01766 [Nematocida parisii ERTm3]KAI5144794.1 hypothetical protein NEPAR07_1289 [Nematocida parisii]EIJ93611.1 hypothetical protein NEPG_01183 [Nematocida parisii ERTm1]KAI5155233.1 hypothetical protein NEPAR06_1655 [Nematocida parisii]KAI5157220.1 hypothetical protein NEPAR05_1102 [Nematocida parisii]|eukprot:XP_013059011.1 hypothetical protein NEPG_01183 [Nematocida parisii ERTm1]
MLAETKKSHQSNRFILVQFILIYFFIHIVIYSSHNYRETIAKEIFELSSKEYSLVEMISVIKLGGSITSTYISQKYIRPLIATFIATCTFILTLFMLINKMVEDKRLVVLLGCLHIIADSSILPTIDAECLAILNSRGMGHRYSNIRVFSTLGHSITYIINMVIQKLINDKKFLSKSILLNTLLFGTITVACILFCIMNIDEVKHTKNAEESAEEAEKRRTLTQTQTENRNSLFNTLCGGVLYPFKVVISNAKFISQLFSINYTTLILCAMGSGISRSSLQAYLSEYLMNTRKSKSDQAYIYFVRTIGELFVWSIVIWLGDRVTLEALLPVGISLGATRSLIYSFTPQQSWITYYMPFIAELFKSVYSALFIYVAVKLAHKFSKPNQKTLAQGIFTGVYSGLAPFLSGLLSYYTFSNTERTDIQNKERLFRLAGCFGVAAATLSTTIYIRKWRSKSAI